MRVKNLLILFLILLCNSLFAEVRMYRQIKDVSVDQKTKVRQSKDQKNLFECIYEINYEKKYVRRISIRRLDEKKARQDNKIYSITKKTDILGSPRGIGGEVVVAVDRDGMEMLELGRRYCFTSRLSPFAQVITGVYKRTYPEKQPQQHHNILP